MVSDFSLNTKGGGSVGPTFTWQHPSEERWPAWDGWVPPTVSLQHCALYPKFFLPLLMLVVCLALVRFALAAPDPFEEGQEGIDSCIRNEEESRVPVLPPSKPCSCLVPQCSHLSDGAENNPGPTCLRNHSEDQGRSPA